MVAWYRSADRAAHHVLLRMSTCKICQNPHHYILGLHPMACITMTKDPCWLCGSFNGHYISCFCWWVFKVARSVQHGLHNCRPNFVCSEWTFRKDWCTRTASEWQRSPVYIWGVPDLPKEQWNQACDLSTLSPSYKWLSWKICAKLEECTVGHDTW